MSNQKLFVGGLSQSTTKETLTEAFSAFGELTDVSLIMDRETGNSRGFAFISFSDGKDADSAMSKLHETELDGRKITVRVAVDKNKSNSKRW